MVSAPGYSESPTASPKARSPAPQRTPDVPPALSAQASPAAPRTLPAPAPRAMASSAAVEDFLSWQAIGAAVAPSPAAELMDVAAAVDVDGGSGEVRRVLGRQERDHCRDFLGGGVAAQGDAGVDGGFLLVR